MIDYFYCWLASINFFCFVLFTGQLMATELWTLATGPQAANSLTRMQHSPRWAGEWGLWAQQWRCVMALPCMAWRMTSVVWDMMTTAWGPLPCTLEATVLFHVWGLLLGLWTDEDWGKISRELWCYSTMKYRSLLETHQTSYSFINIHSGAVRIL